MFSPQLQQLRDSLRRENNGGGGSAEINVGNFTKTYGTQPWFSVYMRCGKEVDGREYTKNVKVYVQAVDKQEAHAIAIRVFMPLGHYVCAGRGNVRVSDASIEHMVDVFAQRRNKTRENSKNADQQGGSNAAPSST